MTSGQGEDTGSFTGSYSWSFEESRIFEGQGVRKANELTLGMKTYQKIGDMLKLLCDIAIILSIILLSLLRNFLEINLCLLLLCLIDFSLFEEHFCYCLTA